MLPLKSKKKQKTALNFHQFDAMKLSVASPEQIHEWSHGEVKKPETINYRTFKPERDGLFCEKIFGPVRNLECHCGKYKTIRYKNVVCDRCGVEVVESKYRRERFGHIDLAYPVSHIWFLKKSPSRIGLVLNMKMESLVKVVYFTHYVALEDLEDKGKKIVSAREVMSTSEYEELYSIYGSRLKADIGSDPIRKLLEVIDLDKEITGIRAVLKSVRIDEIDEYLDKWDELSVEKKRKEELAELFRANPAAKRKIPNIFRELKSRKDKKERRDYLVEKSGNLLTEADRSRHIKRLRVIEGLKRSNIRPEWMVLNTLPVIPPDLRPLVPLEGGRFASSDLNDLYRRIINRNNRLKHTMQLRAPSVIINNEKRLLQEAVDALFDNESRPHPIVAGANSRPLKSLSEALRGKQGRFRQNLLGKRVDYSGRSVIVVGPDLKLNQCGLPKQMALSLFHPFVLRELLKEKHVHQKTSRKMLEAGDPLVWSILENVIKDRLVLLNRAPTLHRLGIQAFEPLLIEGKAIQLHPLTCAAFNADFDGDQMAVHVPLSIEAQIEARVLMMATNNIFSPASGRPIAVPSQDMILGCAYLTMAKKGVLGEGMRFSSSDEVIGLYQRKKADLQAIVKVAGINDMAEATSNKNPETWKDYTTVGRIIFNSVLPEGFGYVNKVMTKKEISKLLDDCYVRFGMSETVRVLDEVKKLGFRFATISGVSISIDQMIVPARKNEIIKEAQKKVKSIISQAQGGLITEGERYSKTLDVWSTATDRISDIVFDEMKKLGEEKFSSDKPRVNSVYLMAESGARGNRQQVRQLAGIRGLMARPQRKIKGVGGEIIETPIISNFREGLNVLEYFISTHGGRKGLSDTALKTAEAGYLTRRLVDVAHSLVVTQEDCGTIKGTALGNLKSGEEIIETMEERIVGRYPVENVTDLLMARVLVSRDTMITPDIAKKIAESGIEKIRARSVLTCESEHGVCARCYGKNLATNKLGEIGDAVGIIAAQSIGEPGTQLTLRTFHVGGAASKISERSEIIATDAGEIEYQNLKYVKEERVGDYIVISRDATMLVAVASLGARRKEAFSIPYGAHVKYVKNTAVDKGEKLAEWDPHYKPIIAEFSGRVKLEDIKEGVTLRLE
ncbi:MAG: DNA-directed RNA polymerase subunit beta', partial [Endomicrobiia bacterium]|nr:DNA-directed RNA polymerase subunit beta' [Endomicrobiia bacterium]